MGAVATGVINSYYSGILVLIGINIILAVSLNLVTGFLGQLVLGHAGFMSVGAYSAALFTMHAGLPISVAFPLGLIFGGLVAAIFGVIIGVPALRIISLSFLFAGYCIVIGSVFQALGNGVYSLIVSVARQLFVLLPSAWILAEAFGLHAVWWSFPIAEIVSILLSILLFGRIYRKKIQTL